MLEVLGIDHVVLRTTQLPAMLRFYQELLGCQVERELPPETGLVQLRAGNALIDLVPVDSELGRLGGGAPRQDGRNMDHLCLALKPITQKQLLQRLRDFGIDTTDFQRRYGSDGFGPSIYVNDPEGNVVELKISGSDSLG